MLLPKGKGVGSLGLHAALGCIGWRCHLVVASMYIATRHAIHVISQHLIFTGCVRGLTFAWCRFYTASSNHASLTIVHSWKIDFYVSAMPLLEERKKRLLPQSMVSAHRTVAQTYHWRA